MIAILNNFDPGTIWEIGYFYNNYKKDGYIFCLSENSKDISHNIMITESVNSVCFSIRELEQLLIMYKDVYEIFNKPYKGEIF